MPQLVALWHSRFTPTMFSGNDSQLSVALIATNWPTLEGWKAELVWQKAESSWMSGMWTYISRQKLETGSGTTNAHHKILILICTHDFVHSQTNEVAHSHPQHQKIVNDILQFCHSGACHTTQCRVLYLCHNSVPQRNYSIKAVSSVSSIVTYIWNSASKIIQTPGLTTKLAAYQF